MSACSAITWRDLIQNRFKNSSEQRKALITKLLGTRLKHHVLRIRSQFSIVTHSFIQIRLNAAFTCSVLLWMCSHSYRDVCAVFTRSYPAGQYTYQSKFRCSLKRCKIL